jgi:ADP-ribose pyrophosphatase YjhB (NUDIX family)
MNDKDLYFVAVKVFLEKEGKFLIFKDGFNQWDIPGGRLKKDEFETPLEDVVKRKMLEELGDNVKFTLGKPIVFMRHERVESTPGNPAVRIFAVGYQATLDEGEPEMKSHHTEMLWVDPNNFKPEDYFTGGWLKGVQEYLEIRKNED